MTIEQLLDCDAEKLKSFTDEQLLAWFTPMFPKTRPECGAMVRKTSFEGEVLTKEEIQEAKVNIGKLKALGIQVDEKRYLDKLRKDKRK